MSKTFKIVGNDISDGYHTFDELYAHRCMLFVALCLQNAKDCYFVPEHYPNWFLLVYNSPSGQISYHIPNGRFHFIDGRIKQNDKHKWDGHTSEDVLKRLEQNSLRIPMSALTKQRAKRLV